METELSRNIDIAKEKAQYDLLCKKILANKTVLAWIMRRTVKEYADMSIEEIKACIEGEPQIASKGVNPGETNTGCEEFTEHAQIQGLSEENQFQGEGKIYYDIRYTAVVPENKEKIRLIINIDYSDFRVIPINSFFRLHLKLFKPVYRNKFLIAS